MFIPTVSYIPDADSTNPDAFIAVEGVIEVEVEETGRAVKAHRAAGYGSRADAIDFPHWGGSNSGKRKRAAHKRAITRANRRDGKRAARDF